MPLKENEKEAGIRVLLGFLECSTDGSITDKTPSFVLTPTALETRAVNGELAAAIQSRSLSDFQWHKASER